jgi:phosphatidylglycerophosphate synthase
MNPMDYKFERFYQNWSNINNILILAGFISAFILNSVYLWLAVIVVSFMVYTFQIPKFLPGFPARIGIPNWISLFRLIIILACTMYWDKLSHITLFVLFCGVILLDGIDGFVARKLKQTSKAGEYLDMEIDALFVFLLCYMHFIHGKLPVWVLIPGGMRYLFGIIFWVIKQPPVLKPGKRFRSTVAVLFFISLLLPFVFRSQIYMPIIAMTSIMIVLSFSISGFYILKNFWTVNH